jgi:CRISPR-associated protein Csd2
MSEPIKNRYEFVYLFDVESGNPDDDPDAGNLPGIDPETNHGITSDVMLKPKIRNFVTIAGKSSPPYCIYVAERAVLNNQHKTAYQALGIEENSDIDRARQWMCQNFYDVRTFGAVMSTGTNCGQVTGPVQLTFARSREPITPLEVSITRMAVTTEEESRNQEGGNRTMGRKHIVPYGLYRAEGFISAHLAAKTGFGEEDLALLWESLINMFDHDHSAARGKMAARRLIVFKHDSALGNAPAHKLFDLVKVSRAEDGGNPARAFSDYRVDVAANDVPKGVEILEMI